jgi:ABC-2 type transport system permease protein
MTTTPLPDTPGTAWYMVSESLRLGVKTMIGRAYPRFISAIREPDWIFYEIALPLLRVIAFVLVYKALKAPPEYAGFVILGGAMMAFWLNVLWMMAAQLHWERLSGNLELYLMAPASMLWILAGMAFGGIFVTLLRAAVIVVVGSLIFGISYSIISLPELALIFVLTLVALYGLGSMLASLYLLYNREVWAIQEMVQEPVALITGFYFPVRALGGYVGGAASLIPLTLGLDAMRQLLFPHGWPSFLPVGWEIIILMALVVLFLIGAARAFAFIERRAQIEGRLTLKWQ